MGSRHSRLFPTPPRPGHSLSAGEGETSTSEECRIQASCAEAAQTRPQCPPKAASLDSVGTARRRRRPSFATPRKLPRRHASTYPVFDISGAMAAGTAILFSEEDIAAMTSGLRTVLGCGGFASVYKGFVADASTGDAVPVAVKLLHDDSFQSNEAMLREMVAVAALRHPGTVRLLGYSSEGSKALVYEFVPGGDLDSLLLKCRRNQSTFSWESRLCVAQGCAAALAFLHDKGVVHRDFKASNVLLTQDLSPRLADFGLAKAMPDSQSHATTRVKGTIGYIDPAYFILGHVHMKSDVYAFGVLLIELLTGRSVVRDAVHESIISSLMETACGCETPTHEQRHPCKEEMKVQDDDSRSQETESNKQPSCQSSSSGGRLSRENHGDKLLLESVALKYLDPQLNSLDKKLRLQVVGIAWLARWCMAKDWDKRPTMKVVLQYMEEIICSD